MLDTTPGYSYSYEYRTSTAGYSTPSRLQRPLHLVYNTAGYCTILVVPVQYSTVHSRRVGRAHWRASSARAISRGSPLARTVKSAPMSGRWSASLLSTGTDTSTTCWALLSLRLTWMQSRTQLIGVVSTQQSPWRLGGATSYRYANMLLGRIQYVGKAYAFNKVQRQYE